MDSRLKELIDFTKEKLDLDSYSLYSTNLHCDKNPVDGIDYKFSMEWLPPGITERTEEGYNPPGTVVVDIDLKSRRLKSVIFVDGKTFVNSLTFDRNDLIEIIHWIEQETGLTYSRQFQIKKEEEKKIQFEACVCGIPVSPAGYIDVQLDDEGRLLLFSVSGHFPASDSPEETDYTLRLDPVVEQIAFQQFKLLEFPSIKQEKRFMVYAMEEVYVSNDAGTCIPVETFEDRHSYLKLNQLMKWDSPMNEKFTEQQLNLGFRLVSVEQAFSSEPHPDTFPLSKYDQEMAIAGVLDFLRKEFPGDTGRWMLHSLHRDMGYIIAELKQVEDTRVMPRKLKVFMDAVNYEALDYLDNQAFIQMFEDYPAPDAVKIGKEEAFEKIRTKIDLTPVYVYDFERKGYILCGKLDSQYGVLANTGDVIELEEI